MQRILINIALCNQPMGRGLIPRCVFNQKTVCKFPSVSLILLRRGKVSEARKE